MYATMPMKEKAIAAAKALVAVGSIWALKTETGLKALKAAFSYWVTAVSAVAGGAVAANETKDNCEILGDNLTKDLETKAPDTLADVGDVMIAVEKGVVAAGGTIADGAAAAVDGVVVAADAVADVAVEVPGVVADAAHAVAGFVANTVDDFMAFWGIGD
jgi:hypothetical protein